MIKIAMRSASRILLLLLPFVMIEKEENRSKQKREKDKEDILCTSRFFWQGTLPFLLAWYYRWCHDYLFIDSFILVVIISKLGSCVFDNGAWPSSDGAFFQSTLFMQC